VFSPDEFKEAIYFGIVRERDSKKMDETSKKYGFVEIFAEVVQTNEESDDAFEIFRKFNFDNIIMIESKVYFEAYFYVLETLQKM
jgi:hypothetical protein